MTNKNPYEIRLDVLKMAQEILDKDFAAKNCAYITKLQQGILKPQSEVPVSPTPEKIITMATSLYGFISTDSRSTLVNGSTSAVSSYIRSEKK